jgi:glycosyltransferase involved in cell wall biosynthesis
MTTISSPDPEVSLLVPEHDVVEPELSIVIPALNEELTISTFVAWCLEGLASAGVVGEILIVDSSTDRTAELAVAGGARVLRTPRRGLGRAYIDALPYVRGKWILMGDADCTYDFRLLEPFVAEFRAGTEYVMGSRWRGSIEPGSMPALHRYLGTPITTKILNIVYSSKFTDIHCGMRGITRDALERMNLQSQSWEYASEMVLKSVRMQLVTAEVPVRFLKDREGRMSHHKREGWLSPFKAAWINLRAMFIYGSDFFLRVPGLILMVIGLLLTLPLSFHDLRVGEFTLSLNSQFLGVTTLAIGCQTFFLGCIAQVMFDYTGHAADRWRHVFPYTRTVLLAIALVVTGLLCAVPLVTLYISGDFRLDQANTIQNHLALTGLAAVITGAQLFTFALVLHGTIITTTSTRPRASRSARHELVAER